MQQEPDIVVCAVPVPPSALKAPIGQQSNRPPQVSLTPGHAALPYDNNNANDIEKLIEQGYTRGLAEALLRGKQAFQTCIWIVDNSGSMRTMDGYRIVEKDHQQRKLVPCTRWLEMQQTVEYHAQLAAQIRSPTTFRLLNDNGRVRGEQQFSVAERGPSNIDNDLEVARKTMERSQPFGVTPLIPHIHEVRNSIVALESELRSNSTKVVLVLATDGLPTDIRGKSDASVHQEFVDSLRTLQGLPVWIVVRLCTDEDEVVQFWNSLDKQLELSVEVIDDFVSEAKGIHEHNPWINYGLPMHRMRERGFHHRLFDLLDERPLCKSELSDYFRLLLGEGNVDGVPDPEEDWKQFYEAISKLVHQEKKTWNPITKESKLWVDLRKLKKKYGNPSSWIW